MRLTHSFSAGLLLTRSVAGLSLAQSSPPARANTTYTNPILPGFHPDPSCIHVPDWDNTYFCASSSFNAFPGIPIHASKDLRNWRLVGHVLNRREQLPRLAETNRSTSGIWAPALRYHNKTFWVLTTLVDDERPQTDFSRWDNIIFKGTDPYNPASWSNAIHFNFTGYDTEPFWDDDGKVYINGAHAWQISPAIQQAEANLDTGDVGEWKTIWDGTGGLAPEGPHLYKRDGYYYLLAAEGGTGLNHMVTISRSKRVSGPFESNPSNPVLSNANTTSYFQTVGHADLFQDSDANWWIVALSTRSGPEYVNYPMGRETVMAPVTWRAGEWPYASQIRGVMSGWPMPPETRDIRGEGPFITDGDRVNFSNASLPMHFTYWRFPSSADTFSLTSSTSNAPSNASNPGSTGGGYLRVTPSTLNLTALNGNYAGTAGQAFVGRRQQDTLFSFRVDVDFHPSRRDEEAGVSTFLTQNHHLDFGVVLLPSKGSATAAFPGTAGKADAPGAAEGELIPHLRYRGISYVAVPRDVVVPLPAAWRGRTLTLEVKAVNATHYTFAAGPADERSRVQTVLEVGNDAVSWGFTGVILGVYCTTNGAQGTGTPAYFSKWRYEGQGQFRD